MPDKGPSISFHYLLPVQSLKDRTRLKSFIAKTSKRNGRLVNELRVIFCSDNYLLDINRKFLGHDHYTDIITFDLSDPTGTLDAEMYISVDRVRDNAQQLGTSFKLEIHRVVFHGVLHLLGYKDKTRKDEKVIRQAEDELLSAYFKRST
ncbi:MAG: rRNA maturation RNase YbeY [Chitinophagaceae bacterium]|nr:rRNA maturation RNase YbeY [Chitinophagaceae bacterium]